MYIEHFGLRERPFRSTPDLAFYYPATGHEQALSQLHQGLSDEEGLLLLTGEPGVGKTLLCHCLLERLGEQVRSAYLTNTHFPDRHAMLQALCFDLSMPHTASSEQELRLALTESCLENFAAGKPTILVIDEAQHLTMEQLEELRLLANLEGRQGRAVQVVLVGQPALLDRLQSPRLAALKQRLAVRPRVGELSLAEAADYLLHQVRVAGGNPEQLLDQEALELLARGTHGQPRLLNQSAHRAFCLAHAAGAQKVDVEAAVEALAQLGLEVDDDTSAPEPDAGNETLVEGQSASPWESVLSMTTAEALPPPPEEMQWLRTRTRSSSSTPPRSA